MFTTRSLAFAATLALAGILPTMMQAGLTGATSDVLDQATHTETWTDAWRIGDDYMPKYQMAQIVTAGRSGFLDRISVYVDNINASNPVSVTIQTVIAGLPSGTIIGHGTIPVSALPSFGAPGWVSVNISGSVSLTMTQGAQYALVVSSTGGSIRCYSTGDIYSGGYMLVNPGGSGWVRTTLGDAMFQAYVILNILDQDQSEPGLPYGMFEEGLTSNPVAQTFTVGQYGILDEVYVLLTNSATSPAPIAVSLRTLKSNGTPSATQVASGTIAADAIPQPGLYTWVKASITPLIVTPGAKYALLLSTSKAGPRWVGPKSDLYPGGSIVISYGSIWTQIPWDFAFFTEVIPPILDQQQPILADWFGISPGGYPWRTSFIPTRSGILPLVSVGLSPSVDGFVQTATVTVFIEEYPSGTVIGSGTIPAATIACCSPNWYDSLVRRVDGGSLQVFAGTEYLIRVSIDLGYVRWWFAGAGASVSMSHKTYVLPVESSPTSPPSPPAAITPCAKGVCPAASGGFTPADVTEGVTSRFQFQERPNGSVQGILMFTDSQPDGATLQGCTTESAVCRLTVKTFACTDQHAITVAGTYTAKGETATDYLLTLSGLREGVGSFTLRTGGGYSYALTQAGIVDVTCPPVP